MSEISSPFFWAGLAVAVASHSRATFATLILLLAHMSLEWYSWGGQWPAPASEVIFMLVHAGMDFTFLHHELVVHTSEKQNWPRLRLILGAVSGLLLVIFCFGYANQPEEQELVLQFGQKYAHQHCDHDHGHSHYGTEWLHPFVLGGVLGCTTSHIFFHIFREK